MVVAKHFYKYHCNTTSHVVFLLVPHSQSETIPLNREGYRKQSSFYILLACTSTIME